MTKPKTDPERLGARERELVDAIFALGSRASAEEIRARLVNPPGDSSVRVMLARLEKKGFVKHQRQGLRYVYSATASPAAAKRTALQRYLQTFFGGSRQEMLTALITESRLSDDEFDALKAEITASAVKGRNSHDPNHGWRTATVEQFACRIHSRQGDSHRNTGSNGRVAYP